MTAIHIHSIILVIIGLIELGLAIFFLATHSGDRVRRYFALFAFGTAMWVLGVGIAELLHYSQTLQNNGVELASLRFAFWGPIIVMSALLMISWLFPYPIYKYEGPTKAVVLFPILLFGLLIMFTGSIVAGIQYSSISYEVVEYGSVYPYFILFIVAYYLWSLITLILKRSKVNGVQKTLLTQFLVGVIGSGIVGVFTNGLMPLLFNNQSLWYLGPEASIIWLGITSYVLLKKT